MSFAAIFTSVWAVPRAVLADNLRILTSRTLPVACDNIVMLSATVLGDPSGHTFEWEQISGEPVIWLESVYQTNVMFQQPATRDDKIFHFVVDKGKAIEKRYEVLVTTIPTDVITTSINNNALLCAAYSYSGEYTNISAMVPAFGPLGSVEVNNPSRAVIFNTPYRLNSSNEVPSVSLLEFNDGEYHQLGSLTYDTLSSLTAIINALSTDKSYILKTKAYGSDSYSKPFSFASSNFLSTVELSITDSDKITTSIYGNNLYGETAKEVISRQLMTLETQDNVNVFGFNQDTNSYTYVVETISRTLTTLDNTDTQETLASSVNSGNLSFSSIVEVKQFQYSSLG